VVAYRVCEALTMAKIIIQKNTGEEFRTFNVSASTVRCSPHSLLSLSAVLHELLKALDEVLDAEAQADGANKPENSRG